LIGAHTNDSPEDPSLDLHSRSFARQPIRRRVEIMVNTRITSSWIIAAWIAALAIIALASVAMDAHRSTTALLVALGMAPGIVVTLVMAGAPSPTVGQILYSIKTKDGRS
jgi:hypothetical protein